MTSEKTYPRSENRPHTPIHPAATCKGAHSSMGCACGWERAGPPAISARLGIPAGRERASQEASRFNSRSNARCTGGWWVHGSKGRPRPFRLRVPGNAGSAAARCMNKTWHCHGAAKAASELKMTRARGPAVPFLVTLAPPTLLRRAGRRRMGASRRPPIAFAVSSRPVAPCVASCRPPTVAGLAFFTNGPSRSGWGRFPAFRL